ncbi:MAG: tetratricopeptide repeat protein [Candidatus Azobacteroides sp.]|nr:tetratricopeptide repeat protein [Candidatus Azobacteroides sp.]
MTLLKKYDDDPEKKTVATTWQISFDSIRNEASKQLLNLCAFFAPNNISTQWFAAASKVLPAPLRKAAANPTDYDDAIAELTKYSLVNFKEDNLSIHRLVQEVIRDSLQQEQTKWRTCCIKILNEQIYSDFSTVESRALFSTLASHILSITDKIGSSESPKEIAILYYFLGFGFDKLVDYSQSLEYYTKALSISEKVLGIEHPDTATTYNNIAEVYYAQGDYDQALEYHTKALNIREKVLGKEHPDTATTYNNIAEVYYAQGDYDQALEYYTKALTIQEKVGGKEHPNTAVAYNNIGGVYYEKGDYDQALEYLTKALTIQEKVLGKEHPNTATSYNNIGKVYDEKGDYDQALEYLTKALTIQEKVLGKEHPNTKQVADNMAIVYEKSGKIEAFEECLKKNLQLLGRI